RGSLLQIRVDAHASVGIPDPWTGARPRGARAVAAVDRTAAPIGRVGAAGSAAGLRSRIRRADAVRADATRAGVGARRACAAAGVPTACVGVAAAGTCVAGL